MTETRRTRPKEARIVSNVCDLRAGELEDLLVRADKELAAKGKRFLHPERRALIVERNYEYLQEITDKVLAKVCPNNLATHFSHLMPHYVIEDGRVNVYRNLDSSSPVLEVYARLKHPCSLAEKIGRKAAEYERVCEANDPHKLMIGDVIGLNVVVRTRDQIQKVRDQIMSLSCLQIEKEEDHRKTNGYTAKHLNLVYNNGNPFMRGLELEIQITDEESHLKSKTERAQAHDTTLKDSMLMLPRTLYGYQLYQVGNSVKLDPSRMEVLETEEAYVVRDVPNRIQRYVLIVPKHG